MGNGTLLPHWRARRRKWKFKTEDWQEFKGAGRRSAGSSEARQTGMWVRLRKELKGSPTILFIMWMKANLLWQEEVLQAGSGGWNSPGRQRGIKAAGRQQVPTQRVELTTKVIADPQKRLLQQGKGRAGWWRGTLCRFSGVCTLQRWRLLLRWNGKANSLSGEHNRCLKGESCRQWERRRLAARRSFLL